MFERSRCPIANVLDLFGDKWTLLVVRDILVAGRHRSGELEANREAIPSNLLADRLERLLKARVTRGAAIRRNRRATSTHDREGGDLGPLLREMARWANSHMPGTECRRRN